jgi:hypothetical protein
MSKNDEKEFFIHFDHPVRCITGDCQRLTNWGHAVYWDGGTGIMLSPLCWEHGFALRDFVPTGQRLTAQHIKEQYGSVERFVVGYHGGKGTATVMEPCDPQEVPRFTPCRPEDDEISAQDETWPMPHYAWYVRYELKGIRRYGYALFVSAESRFDWYEAREGI